MLTTLQHRHVIPERMDDPGLDPVLHAGALAGLRRLNRAARASACIARPMLAVARRRGLSRVSVLDIACGGGDVSVGAARLLARQGVSTALTFSDISPTALATAQALAARHGVASEGVLGSAPDNLPKGAFDFVTCTLFLHHLSREDVVATLREMAARARVLLVVADLRRSRWGYFLASTMCRVLSRSPIVHFDGPVSVRAAWTIEEMRAMAQEAGIAAGVEPCWPARMLLTAEKQA